MSRTSSLSLLEIKLIVNLGWEEEERKQPQAVILDIFLHFTLPPKACETDELTDAICYRDLLKKLTEHLARKEFRLIEYLAKYIFDFIKKNSNATHCQIKLTKFPLVPGLSHASFSYGDAEA